MVKRSSFDAFIILFIFFITMFISVIGGIFLFLLYVLLNSKFSTSSFIYVIFIYSLIAFTQYSDSTHGDYDLIRYYTVYDFLSRLSFIQAIPIILGLKDIFFYINNFFLTRIFPNDPRIMSFFFIFTSSFLILQTIKNIKRYNSRSAMQFSRKDIIFWMISFFLIISFTNYTNVFRQFFALSLLFFAISRRLNGEKYIIFLFFAVLSHWSIAVYIVFYLITYFFKKKINILYIIYPGIAVLLYFIMPYLPYKDKIEAYFYGDEILGIDKTLMFVMILLQIFISLILSRLKQTELFVIFTSLFLYGLFFMINSTIVTRHFYTISVFFTILFISFYNTSIRKLKIYFTILCCLFIFYNLKNIYLDGENAEYYFFSKKQYMMSAIEIFQTPFPTDILRK